MIIEQIRCGGDRNFAYLVACEATKEAALFDPSYSPKEIVAQAEALGLTVMFVCNTHGHPDHVNGNDVALELTGATLVGHPVDIPTAGLSVENGSEFAIGQLAVRVLHTPGHTPGSVMFLVTEPGNPKAPPQLITGDTLFVGKIGGTATEEQARSEFDAFHQVVKPTVPGDAIVWPGHDYGVAPQSTMAHEWETNPFLQRSDFADFLWLKNNWADYKREHGIA